MKKVFSELNKTYIALIAICFLSYQQTFARAGGGGGHSSGGHSSGGGFSGGGHFGGGGFIGGGSSPIIIILIVIGIIVYFYLKNKTNLFNDGNDDSAGDSNGSGQSLPEGLDSEKIQTAFLSIQEAWQNKDLKKVRKWISDGVYQRFNAQFAMMNKLGQVNKLSSIRINSIHLSKADVDGNYQTADVSISFTMDDEFISDKYHSFNQKFRGDSAKEYWTFIKRQDAQTDKNLYDNNNCPNCGAPFDINMGEISRCGGCGTLTNNASYDWVLSEITQEDDYSGGNNFSRRYELQELTKNDSLFSVQRIEDVASNIFMQVMEVMSGESDKILTRFSDEETTSSILKNKKEAGDFVFDRLYLNNVDLVDFNATGERLNLNFSLNATYQRVQAGQKLTLIDSEMITESYRMVLSKNIKALQTAEKETVFSYECAKCGAPYSDTTNDVCQYCSAPLIDFNRNWVLTYFNKIN